MFGKIDRNPYERLRGQFNRGDRENVEYLTEEEMQTIMALELPEGSLLTRCRDLFVFQMWTGLSYSDAGKTGSAEYTMADGQIGTHSWFAGFSNVEDPDIVVVVLAENGGSGSSTAVPIAHAVFDAYYYG